MTLTLPDWPKDADYFICILGPGGMVNQPTAVIQRALEETGIFSVEVRHDHSDRADDVDKTLEWIKSPDYPKDPRRVVIYVEHVPWGG